MKTKFRGTKQVELKDIPVGETFGTENSVYIKTDKVDDEYGWILTVNLMTGTILYINSHDLVYPTTTYLCFE